jgi:hypothetical protein
VEKGMITYTFGIKETDEQLIKRIQKDMVSQVNELFESSVPAIQKRVMRILERSVRSQPEWYSVARGSLRQHFGLPNSLRNIQNTLSIWLSTVQVEYKKMRVSANGNFSGGIRIKAVRAGYQDVIRSPDGFFITEKGDRLDWVKWLLTAGSNIIIKDYDIARGRGRAGSLIMRPTTLGGWGVPAAYQGTKDDNMITRAIKMAEPEIEKEIARIIK